MTLIRIDRNSIRKNPDAGHTSFFVKGREWEERHPDGSITHHAPVEVVHTMYPAPTFLFDYVPAQVTCEDCGASFLHTELEADSVDCDAYSTAVCPRCKTWDCCEIEYEKLTAAEMKGLPDE